MTWFEALPKLLAWALVIVMTLIIGLLDYVTGFELSLSPLYVVPTLLAAWCLGSKPGMLMAFAESATLVLSNRLAGQSYSSDWILVANIGLRGVVFATLACIASSFRLYVRETEQLSLMDPLTGALNRRGFYQALSRQIALLQRGAGAFSIAYIDVDDFKRVNDVLGHEGGDRVLQALVSNCRQHLRGSDIVGRLGGDEFALLLSDADSGMVRDLLPRVLGRVTEALHGEATFSVGVLTIAESGATVAAALLQADQLMYQVKNSGKNSILYASYPYGPNGRD